MIVPVDTTYCCISGPVEAASNVKCSFGRTWVRYYSLQQLLLCAGSNLLGLGIRASRVEGFRKV